MPDSTTLACLRAARHRALNGYLAFDDTRQGERPGILVFPEAFGLNDHARERADRAAWRSMAQAAYDALLAQPFVDRRHIGAIGFCFGGTTCLELVRTGAAVGALATFHAGLNVGLPEDAGRIRSKVLICHGADDPLAQKGSVEAFTEEMRREKVDWQVVFHGNTVHSFTAPEADKRGSPAFAYNKNAEGRSWAAMRHLFAQRCRRAASIVRSS